MMKLNAHSLFLILLIFCLFLLGISFLLQYSFHLTPCPLCLVDRALVILCLSCLVIACYHRTASVVAQKIYSSVIFLLASMGILTTGRHLWLLHVPPEQAPACGPGLRYLLETLPFTEAMQELFLGSGECAQNQGEFLGLSLPGWTMVAFISIAIGALLLFWKANYLKNKQIKSD